jgi:prevent-host-death family protein
MDESVSATEANRRFSSILRRVREGDSFTVTSHGAPVARIVPVKGTEAARDRAVADLIALLRRQPVAKAGRWTRDELYEDKSS